MNIEEKLLIYASVAGRLRGVISGMLKFRSDELPPSIKKILEEALESAEGELDIPKEERTLPL